MTDNEVIQFAHNALFRRAPGELTPEAVEQIAAALWDTVANSTFVDDAPIPFGRASGAWLVSPQVKQWVGEHALALRNDLAMFVHLSHTPVGARAVQFQRQARIRGR